MPNLSIQDISHLAHLARLELTAEEKERFARQLSTVVEYVEQLSGVKTPQGEIPLGVTGLTTVLAEDTLRSPDDLAAINPLDTINQAPSHNGRFFRVRAVMAGEGGGA